MKTILKLAFVIVLAGVGYGGYEYYTFQNEQVPQYEGERKQLEQKVGSKQQELKKVQEFSKNIESIKQELKELNAQLEVALEHMPRQFNLAALLRRLHLLAQNSGLELHTFKPSSNEEKSGDAFYSTLNIDFEIRGTYTQILLFLDQVSRLKRIINTDAIKFIVTGGSSDNANKTSGVMLSASAKVKTYRFIE